MRVRAWKQKYCAHQDDYLKKHCSKNISTATCAQTHTVTVSVSPGEAPPGTGQRAEDSSEGQSREERVQGEVEQSLHAIIAQAFQWINVVLKENSRKPKKLIMIKKQWLGYLLSFDLCAITLFRPRQFSSATSWWKLPSVELSICWTSLRDFCNGPNLSVWDNHWKRGPLSCFLCSTSKYCTSALENCGRAFLSRLERCVWMFDSALCDWVSTCSDNRSRGFNTFYFCIIAQIQN